jgi:hypothetical protein
MPTDRLSLLAGRNRAPLTSDEIRRAVNTFLGLDEDVSARYDQSSPTAFHEVTDTSGTYGEVVFGPDIYPGSSVVDPNSALSLDAAAAHELTHYHRWKDKTALTSDDLEHLDEALTSLLAIFRYDRHLSDTDIRQLVADAVQRLQLFVRQRQTVVAAVVETVAEVLEEDEESLGRQE